MSCNSARFHITTIVTALMLAAGTAAWAQSEGQADLDDATQLKLNAQSMADLERVVELCESAIQKGLDEESTKLAKSLAAATLYQHGSRFAQAIFNPGEQAQRPGMLKDFALRDFYKALEFDDSSVELHMVIGRLEAIGINGQRPNAASLAKGKQSADRAVELAADNKALLSEALVIRSNYQPGFEQRFEDLDKAVDADPTNVNAIRTRGVTRTVYAELLAASGKPDDAKAQRQLAVEDFKRLLDANPEDPASHQAIAELFDKLGDAAESLTHIESAIQLNPRSPTPFRMRARIYSSQQKFDEAIADLNRAIDLQPDAYQLYLERYGVNYEKGDEKAASSDYDRAKEMEPGALVDRIRAATMHDDFKRAIDELVALVAADDAQAVEQKRPANPALRLQLGNLFVLNKRPSLAIEAFGKALESEDLPPALRLQTLRGRGDAYLSLGKQAEAVADYEAAYEIDPQNDGVLNNLAWVLATSPKDDLRDGKRAVELATKACEVTDFKAPHILSTLAAAYAESGDFDKAKEWSSKAVETDQAGGDKVDGGMDVSEQLKSELKSYQEGKPWRELQQVEESPAPTDNADAPQDKGEAADPVEE